jgi:hypothetical protein
VRFPSVTIAALVLSATLAFGAEGDAPRIRNGSIGFNAQFRNRFWTPLIADIENPGPARTCYLGVEGQGRTSGQQVLFSRTVRMPANSYRRFEFPVFPDLRLDPDPGKVKIETVFMFQLTDGKLHVWDKLEVLGNPHPEDGFFVLAADSRFASYLFLKGNQLGAEKRPIGRAIVQPRILPKRPLYYDAFDAVIVGDPGDQSITPLQERALETFVRQGGHLIVLPGNPLSRLAFDRLLPADYLARHEVETLPPVAGDHLFARGLPLQRLAVRSGTVWAGTAENPLAVSRPEGLGTVTALAFDTGHEDFQQWSGGLAFCLDLFERPVRLLPWADRLLERARATEGILSGLAGIKVLSRQGVLLYLAGVAGGLLLVPLLFRLTRRPEWGWAVAVVLALGAGTGAIIAAGMWKAQPRAYLNELAIAIAPSGAAAGQVQAALGLFSPHEASYALAVPDDDLTLRPGPSHRTPPEQFRVEYVDQPIVTNLLIRTEDVRQIYGRGAVQDRQFPRVQVRVTGNGLQVVAHNRADQPLEDCFLKYNRFVLPLGDLAAGATWQQDDLTDNPAAYTARLVRSSADELRARLRAILFPEPSFGMEQSFSFEERRFYSRFRGREPGPVLFGWTSQPQLPLGSVTPAATRRTVGLWATAAELEFAGPMIDLPKGVMPLRLLNRAAATSERGEARFAGTRPTEIVAEFALPPGCPDLTAQELTIHLQFRGSAFRPEVLAAPAGATLNTDDLHGFEALPGGDTYHVDQPARFLDGRARRVVIAVRVQSAARGSLSTENVALGLNHWQIRDFDVALKGTVR